MAENKPNKFTGPELVMTAALDSDVIDLGRAKDADNRISPAKLMKLLADAGLLEPESADG